uniref:Uncharacterized protein n=1 Tax=Bionectria ochroleuca TaxID=29856 RepID=A0A8H7N9F2_BIOOC
MAIIESCGHFFADSIHLAVEFSRWPMKFSRAASIVYQDREKRQLYLRKRVSKWWEGLASSERNNPQVVIRPPYLTLVSAVHQILICQAPVHSPLCMQSCHARGPGRPQVDHGQSLGPQNLVDGCFKDEYKTCSLVRRLKFPSLFLLRLIQQLSIHSLVALAVQDISFFHSLH